VGDLAGTYNNGMNTRLCDGFQSSTCLNHTYLVPIVNTPCGGPINQSSPIIGFAAVTLTGANCTGAGYQKYFTVQPKFVDCNLAANAIICQRGFGATDSCPDCGTGTIRLVK